MYCGLVLFRAGQSKTDLASLTVCWHITAITFCRCLLHVLKLDFWSSSDCRTTAQCQGRCLQKIWTKRLSCANTRYVRGLTDLFLTFNARSVARVKSRWLHILHQIDDFRYSIKSAASDTPSNYTDVCARLKPNIFPRSKRINDLKER